MSPKVPPNASGPQDWEALARHCRKRVRRHALMAAGVAVLPVPGVDWLTDAAVLMKLLPEIQAQFGLSAAQIERLDPDRRAMVYKTLAASGQFLIGKLITRQMVVKLLASVGVRLSAQQAAKFVPLAGQAASAVLTYSALKMVCDQHIRDCQRMAAALALPAPEGTRAQPR